jgi:SAM-dependent methyltransferase
MVATKDIPQTGTAFRMIRAVFRAIAPDSLVAMQRDFRNKLAARGLKYTLQLRADSYFGKLRCSVCNRRVRQFEPLSPSYLQDQLRYGWKYTAADAETCNQESYSCPHCEATDRDRLYALYLSDYFRSVTGGSAVKIVDFAPSPPLSVFIRKSIARAPYRVSYVTADLFRHDVDDNVDIMDMNLYRDESVDFFICSHVLEHVENDRKALAELYRILKQGGRGILIVPILLTDDVMDEDPSVTDPAERWRRFGQNDHVRRYSKREFLLRTQQAGFGVQQLGWEQFGKDAFDEHGITERSVLYVVEKV